MVFTCGADTNFDPTVIRVSPLQPPTFSVNIQPQPCIVTMHRQISVDVKEEIFSGRFTSLQTAKILGCKSAGYQYWCRFESVPTPQVNTIHCNRGISS